MKAFTTIFFLIIGEIAVGQTGISCNDSTFWAMDISTVEILQFQLNDTTVISSPSPVSIPPLGWSLAFCNNLSGGTFSPTFYSDDGYKTAFYYNGTTWVADSTSIHHTQNAAGAGNYLYYYDQNSTLVERFDGTSFTTIYNDTSGLKIACADLATDDSGNIWILRNFVPFEAIYIDVISRSGVPLKRYNISLNTSNAYGVMLMNGVLYVGLGTLNVAHPSTLIPFTFTVDSATQGVPISMPENADWDLASCHAGAPVFFQCSLAPPVVTSNQSQICASDSASVCAPANFAAYHWNNDSTTSCITTNLAGNYYVTITDAYGCTAESNHVALSVYPLPSVSISLNGDTLSVYDAVTRQWYLNGSAINNATSNIYIVTQAGSYTVVVTDTNGCVATSSAVQIIFTGTENITSDEVVSVFPNPTNTNWHLVVTTPMLGGIVEISDNNGRNVFESVIRNLQSEINFDAARGVYFLRISSSKKSVVKKLVKL